MGPTASGKTDTAVALAQTFPFEIISVDSSMVYRGMDIGTAKPDQQIQRSVPHHLIDIRDPNDTYSAALFCEDVAHLVADITARGKYPLLVGGTMFYFRALELGLPAAPSAHAELRRTLERRGSQQGWSELHRELAALDPRRAAQIDPADRQRIQRALEIVLLTGQSPPKELRGNSPTRAPIIKLALAPEDRSWLHQRIEQRFLRMLDVGLLDEVSCLLTQKKLSPELPALRMVGYRQAVQFLSEELEYNDMVRRGIAATRQLAKRQLTWLRNQPGVTWLNCASQSLLETAVTYVDSRLSMLGVDPWVDPGPISVTARERLLSQPGL